VWRDLGAGRATLRRSHGLCGGDLFLIRTEEGRRTTENTEFRVIPAKSLIEQVILHVIEVRRDTGAGRREAVP
jgi:hypothetical protein